MIVLSLFDGMSCGYEALERAGIFVEKYYASEIDKHAMQIAKKNHPNIVHLGDVTRWREWDIPKPDLIIGGSPCQGFSFAGKQLAFDDPRSKLFFDMIDIIDHYDPDFRLLENVKMKKEYMDVITEYMCVEPHFINSSLVSAQNRQRYYWYNWNAPTPEDRGIMLADVIDELDNQPNIEGWQQWWIENGNFQLKKQYSCIMDDNQKAICMTARQVLSWNGNLKRCNNGLLRFLNTVEAERLQTLPDNYTEGVSNTQRYKMIGNGWTVEVLAHLFSHMPINDLERMMQ